jgi:hypothetical protein
MHQNPTSSNKSHEAMRKYPKIMGLTIYDK